MKLLYLGPSLGGGVLALIIGFEVVFAFCVKFGSEPQPASIFGSFPSTTFFLAASTKIQLRILLLCFYHLHLVQHHLFVLLVYYQ